MASGEQRHRDQEREMRLVAERTKTDPGKDWPAVDPQSAGAEQCRRQKRILPQAERPEGRRERQYRDHRPPVALGQNLSHHDQAEGERRRLENQEGRQIRQTGEGGAQQQEHRRIVEEPVLDAGRCGALFGGVMGGLVVGQFRLAGIGQGSGRIKADEIGTGGPSERHDQPVGSGDEKKKPRCLDREQDPAIGKHAIAVERGAENVKKAQCGSFHGLSDGRLGRMGARRGRRPPIRKVD
jgi:hypothetical protein